MKKIVCGIFAFFALSLFAAIDKDKVFVVANNNDANSMELARYYCSMRAIPEKNIVALAMPKNNGFLSRADYFKFVENPLMEALVKNGALSAIDLAVVDDKGRREVMLTRVNLDYLVLCKGIPWAISEEKSEKPPAATNATAACVDSEISARFLKQKKFNGFISNPSFGKVDEQWRIKGLIRVARLDGATFDDVKKSLTKMMSAEQNGLRGRVYIDKSKYAKQGDDWMDSAAKIFIEAGYDVSIDDKRAVMGLDARMDGAAFYFGWYSGSPCGYFSIPEFSLADGAIGWHIFSFSGYSFAKNRWVSSFVSKNAAVTDGNVFEPFLALTRNIRVFTRLLFSTETQVLPSEAGFASLLGLSWQNMYLGDPLYNPFKKDLQAQLNDIENGKIDEFSQYAVIRKANLIDKQQGRVQALNFLRRYIVKIPDVALIWKIAEFSEELSAKQKFAQALYERGFYRDVQYVGLAFEVANFLMKDNSKDALAVYEGIFDAHRKSMSLRRLAAKKAELAAQKCGLNVSASVKDELNKMVQEEIKKAEQKFEEKLKQRKNKK